jgi:hypothetical protein
MPAQIVVNPLVRQRAQEDDERKRRPQQLGTEDRRPSEGVESVQSRDYGLDPRPLVARASGAEQPTGAACRRVVVRARRRRIIPANRRSQTGPITSGAIRAGDGRRSPSPISTRSTQRLPVRAVDASFSSLVQATESTFVHCVQCRSRRRAQGLCLFGPRVQTWSPAVWRDSTSCVESLSPSGENADRSVVPAWLAPR